MRNDHWTTVTPWFFSDEPAALESIRQLLPTAGRYRAWTNFSFRSESGQQHNVDLLVAVPHGLYLIELDIAHGNLRNVGDVWLRSTGRQTTASDRLDQTAATKAEHLTRVLRHAAAGTRMTAPPVQGAVFLSSPPSSINLTPPLLCGVYGPDEPAGLPLPRITHDLLRGSSPDRAKRLRPRVARALPELLRRVEIEQIHYHTRVDSWQLTEKPVSSTDRWQDFVAWSTVWDKAPCRVRLYAPGPTDRPLARQRSDEAVLREYLLLRRLDHPGIVAVHGLGQHPAGPALIFHVEKKYLLRLDHLLALYGTQLDAATQADMIRQIGAALAYAYSQHVSHGALSTRSVMAIPRPPRGAAMSDGWVNPELQLTDWHDAATATPAEDALTATSVRRDLRGLVTIAQEICANGPPARLANLLDFFNSKPDFRRLHPAKQVQRLTSQLVAAAWSERQGLPSGDESTGRLEVKDA